MKTIIFFSKQLIITSLLVGLFPAQAAEKELHGDWLLDCDQICVIKQGLRNPAKPKITYGIEILKIQGTVVASFNFPLGIYLPPGISIKAGNLTKDVPVSTCLPAGCSAALPMSDDLIDSLKTSNTLKVRFFLKDNKPNEITYSLKGFSKAFDALTSR